MWRLHERQIRFGMTCGTNCDCEQGWSTVFRKGDVLRDLVSASSEKKRPSSTSSTQRVPRKRSRRDPPVSALLPQNAQMRASSALSVRDASSVHTTKQGNLTHLHQQGFYRVTFDTQLPLGFISTTEVSGSRKVCRVVSVDPAGQCQRKGPLVKAGATG